MPIPIPPDLVEAIAKGDAVLFIGAGLSAGAGLPGWSALLTPLADEIDLPPVKRGDLLMVAHYCQNNLGRQLVDDSTGALDHLRTSGYSLSSLYTAARICKEARVVLMFLSEEDLLFSAKLGG